MRRYVYYFLVFQLLDIITTYVGISKGLNEGNPIFKDVDLLTVILIKLFAMYVVADLIQNLKDSKIWWVLPIESAIFVMWNSFNLLLIMV